MVGTDVVAEPLWLGCAGTKDMVLVGIEVLLMILEADKLVEEHPGLLIASR